MTNKQRIDPQSQSQPEPTLTELELEASLGAVGIENSQRSIPLIDLDDFERRKPEITDQLWQAAVDCGFFQVSNHGISIDAIEDAFSTARRFFDLPHATKALYPLLGSSNAGWESRAQVRPSTRAADQKESYQITRPRMQGLWPTAQLPGFQNSMLGFESQAWAVAMRILSCFADKLGFDSDFFMRAHNPAASDYQSTLRLLHYYATDDAQGIDRSKWRAGAHTDFDCLTLLFQKSGQAGLQVCPGREALSNEWTSVVPRTGLITCNIGDMLMRWSDDELKSTLHRVRMPQEQEYQGSRYTLAFFAQANEQVEIAGPGGKYEPISARDYLQQRINANFGKKY